MQNISKIYAIDFHFSLQFPIIHLFIFSNKYGENSFTTLYKDIFLLWRSCDYIKALPLTYFLYPNPEFLEERDAEDSVQCAAGIRSTHQRKAFSC